MYHQTLSTALKIHSRQAPSNLAPLQPSSFLQVSTTFLEGPGKVSLLEIPLSWFKSGITLSLTSNLFQPPTKASQIRWKTRLWKIILCPPCKDTAWQTIIIILHSTITWILILISSSWWSQYFFLRHWWRSSLNRSCVLLQAWAVL